MPATLRPELDRRQHDAPRQPPPAKRRRIQRAAELAAPPATAAAHALARVPLGHQHERMHAMMAIDIDRARTVAARTGAAAPLLHVLLQHAGRHLLGHLQQRVPSRAAGAAVAHAIQSAPAEKNRFTAVVAVRHAPSPLSMPPASLACAAPRERGQIPSRRIMAGHASPHRHVDRQSLRLPLRQPGRPARAARARARALRGARAERHHPAGAGGHQPVPGRPARSHRRLHGLVARGSALCRARAQGVAVRRQCRSAACGCG